MSVPADLMDLYEDAACRQPEAVAFLTSWHQYCHDLDDVVDDPECEGTCEVLLASQARAACLYSCPFFQQNIAVLRPLVLLIASAWGDSVAFERGDDEGLKRYADSLRLVGNEMVCAVALLCGGFTHLRKISPRLRRFAWENQHPFDEPAEEPVIR